MSDIKILRLFIKVILSYDKNIFTSNMGNDYLIIKRYKNSQGYTLQIVSNFHHLSFLSYKDLKFNISISDKTVMVIDLNEFLNSDDTSLVLRYGRDILDENIVDTFNRYHSSTKLSLSDFDTFFIRMGLI